MPTTIRTEIIKALKDPNLSPKIEMAIISGDYTMKQLIFYWNMISFNMILHEQKGEMDLGINWSFGDTANTPDGSYRHTDEDLIVLFLNAWMNHKHRLPPVFHTIRELLSNPDLPIASIVENVPFAFMGMKIKKTIQIYDEHGDKYVIEVETGSTRWIKNGVGSGVIEMSKEESEHIAFMALTHYNRVK